MKLYHYVHCPFCVRVRMALGLLNLEYKSIVLPYDDEKTPLDLMGKKMLPIFEFKDGDEDETTSNESLQIIQRLDQRNILKNELIKEPRFKELEELLSKIGSDVHSLCMPYWIWTPEFNDSSRKYFTDKKEVKRGPFKKLIQNKDQYLNSLNKTLEELESELGDFYQSDELTILDICLASHLWGMYIFPEFQFSEKIDQYLKRVKSLTRFEYHEDFWKD